MNSRNNVKDIVIRDLKYILQHSELIGLNNCFVTHNNDEVRSENGAARNLSKSIKLFIESNLNNAIDNQARSIVCNTTKETWKIDTNNLLKVLHNELNISEVQESLFNILDSCVREINNSSVKYINDSELDCSPLLQPKHIIQVADCMSVENPLDVRLNALQCLLKSHFTDAVNGEGWFFLKKILVENLCDNNQDIFLYCMKAHAKLASCSSSVAIKECTLNLMESLSQHYFISSNEPKTISLQNINFYHMAYLTRLLLDTLKEATLNIARFGDSKLDEMIENFIQLMSIHPITKQNKNKFIVTPLEVVSYLDPNGRWISNLTHFCLSRQLLFSSIHKNMSFIKIIIEELINWISEPVIPSRATTKVLQGDLNNSVQMYCMFCHSLSVLSTLCSFKAGRELLSITDTENEESLSIRHILKIIFNLLNDRKFNETINAKATKTFKSFIVEHLANILSSKIIQDSPSIFMLGRDNHYVSPITIQVYYIMSLSKHFRNLFIYTNMSLKRKFALVLQDVFAINSYECTHPGSTCDREIELPATSQIHLEPEHKEVIPLDDFLKLISSKLKTPNLKEIHYLIKILTQMLKENDRELGISYTMRQHFIYIVSESYIQFRKSYNFQESKLYNNKSCMIDCCTQFLLNNAITSLGFHILQENKLIASLLIDGFQNTTLNWSDSVWLSFVFKSATTHDGCAILFEERDVIIRNELTKLWSVIDEDCSGSELPIESSSKFVLNIIGILTFTLRGVKVLLNDSKYGSELTLTDEDDARPTNINSLIHYYALNSDSCPDFIHHQFALTTLKVIASNMDSNLFLQSKFKYQDSLLQMQAVSRIDDNSEVIIDECSLLRQKIIELSCFPSPERIHVKPTHITPRPESIGNQTKPRYRGTGELARWLSETRLSLHDYSWLKHARKLYKNSWSEDMKWSIILDLLEQVVKVYPDTRTAVKWGNVPTDGLLLPEEELAVQLVMRYGTHHRLIQSTQQNVDNLCHLILLVKHSLKKKSNVFEGFDWFVASAFLICSGNLEKTQYFLTSVSGLPTAQLLWITLADETSLVQIGQILENIIAEELPIAFQALQSAGLSWWHMCQVWISQCWWNMFDWTQICHWFTTSILHQPDYPIYFCAALLNSNQDRLVLLTQQEAIYELIMHPVNNFQLSEARIFIDKLHKKYHNLLQPYFSSNLN